MLIQDDESTIEKLKQLNGIDKICQNDMTIDLEKLITVFNDWHIFFHKTYYYYMKDPISPTEIEIDQVIYKILYNLETITTNLKYLSDLGD